MMRRGFTIVELLIVIVVIAILAAVTLVVYMGVQQRAALSALESQVAQAAKAVELYKIQHDDRYPATLAVAGVLPPSEYDADYYPVNDPSDGGFCVQYAADVGTYYANSSDGSPREGECIITNLMINPSFETNHDAWTENAGGPSGVTTNQSLFGTRSGWFQRSSAAATTINVRGETTGAIPAVPGDTFHVTVHTTAKYVDAATKLTLRWNNSATNQVTTAYVDSVPGDFLRIDATISNAPSGTTSLRVWVQAQVLAGSDDQEVYVDGVMVTAGEQSYRYADGDSPGWSWNGTPHASTSTGPAL